MLIRLRVTEGTCRLQFRKRWTFDLLKMMISYKILVVLLSILNWTIEVNFLVSSTFKKLLSDLIRSLPVGSLKKKEIAYNKRTRQTADSHLYFRDDTRVSVL